MSDADNDFDAAKSIAELLKNMDKERQQRVLRWVAESLGLAVPGPQAQHTNLLDRGLGEGLVRSPISPIPGATGRAIDIKSFVESKRPKSDIQFAAVVAYYYRFEAAPGERREAITAENLQDAARLASRTRFTRPHMTLNNAKNQGYLDSAERGAFQINSVGENLVAMTLPGDGESAPQKQRSRSKRK